MLKVIELTQNWLFYYPENDSWYSANVPGCIHTDLLAHQLIPDPFYQLNEKEVQWIENKSWNYVWHFAGSEDILSNDAVELVFKGIDVYAEVILNGVSLGNTNNMFHEWRFPCREIIKIGQNELQVLFKSPIQEALPLFKAVPFEYPANNDEGQFRVSSHTRKSPYQYGWDWGPRLVTSGLWRPVVLECWKNARINDVRMIQKELTDSLACIDVETEVWSNTEQQAQLLLQVDDDKATVIESSLKKGHNLIKGHLYIPNPKRWWPNGLGSANLYHISVRLQNNNVLFDTKTSHLGLRTIELINEKDKEGNSFLFKINGHQVFMKGANIIPGDCFPSSVTRKKYEELVSNAVDANMNMLRVWGGGIYEDDYFYELCDKNGLLIWQDFMFACGMYPANDDMIHSLTKEFDYNIKRLRNHPCIALWCGNNEVLEGFHTWGWKEKLGEHAAKAFSDYEKIFYHLLPERLQALDPDRPYWPSSPSSDYKEKLSYSSGDYHFWDIVKEDLPITIYRERIGRFMSEYGFKSYPEEKTLRSYSTEADWDIRSEVLESHQGWATGADLVERNLLREYKKPKDFLSFQYVSYLLQAEAIGLAIEAHRCAKPRCWGSLYWQLNDCWPCASWSSVDYFNHWKALHYRVKKSFEPVILSTVDEKEKTNIYIVSDVLKPIKGKLLLQIMDFNGAVLKEYSADIMVPANSSTIFYSKKTAEWLDGIDESKVFLFAQFKSLDAFCETIHYFTKIRNLDLQSPSFQTEIFSTYDKEWLIELQSSVLAKNVKLSTPALKSFFSDNYFDMMPLKKYSVKITTFDQVTDFKSCLKIQSLTDSY